MAASSADHEQQRTVDTAIGPVEWSSTDQAADARRNELVRIYHEEHDRLVRTVALITSSVPSAEDVVQESFAKLHSRLGDIENPGAWLHTVSVNAARNVLRQRLVRRRYVEAQSPPVAAEADPRHGDLLHSLRRLPARQRAVIVLRFYEDRPIADIAELLGMRVGTVKSNLHRGLAALRMEIEP